MNGTFRGEPLDSRPVRRGSAHQMEASVTWHPATYVMTCKRRVIARCDIVVDFEYLPASRAG